MGDWSKWELGRERLPERAIIFGGNTPRSSIDRMVNSYDRVLFHKHDNYEPFIVESNGAEMLLAFQVYGAALVADLLWLLADGGVGSAVFVGAAYGRHPELRVADCVVPTKVRCLDGFSIAVGAANYVHPDPDLRDQLLGALRTAGESFREGPTVSVPSTFFHGDEAQIPPEVLALEIEAASFLHVANRNSLSAAAVLIISDNATHSLRDDRATRDERILRVFNALREPVAR